MGAKKDYIPSILHPIEEALEKLGKKSFHEKIPFKKGDIVFWESEGGHIWRHMILGFSNKPALLAGDDALIYVSQHDFWRGITKDDIISKGVSLNEEEMKRYLQYRPFMVHGLTGVRAFVSRYSRTTQDIPALQKELREKGFIFIPAMNSTTGKTVAFFNEHPAVLNNQC